MSKQALLDTLLGAIRHALTLGAGYIVAHGWATNDQASALTGGLVALCAIAWSAWESRNKRVAVNQALATPTPGSVSADVVSAILQQLSQQPTSPPGYVDAPPSS